MPSNATETIDARILRLIGLEDIFDLDYDTYLTLLKEAMVKGRMPQTTIPSEEVELLTDEWKRVKTKKDSGRFKVKKKKITATTLKTGGILIGKNTSIPASKLLSAAQTGGVGGGFNIGESFSKIAESVTSIAKTLKEKFLLSKKEAAFDRKSEEDERRKLQQQNLKKRFAKMAAVAQKILQPVQSLLDKLINYFVNIFLGMAVIKLLKWFSNDENKKKVKSFVRFIGDWWPALVGGWLLFGTGIGGLVASFVPMVVGWTAKLVGVVASNPILAAALALGTAGLWAPKLFPGLANEDERETDKQVKEHGKDNVRSELERLSNNPNWLEKFQGKDIVAKEKLHYMDTGESKRYNNGGWIVPGSGSGDTVDAKLTPGEVVINKPTVDAFGPDYFLAHNSLYGGPNANKPQMMGGTMFASSGGMVGRESGSYRVPPWKDVGAEVLKGLGDIGLPGFGGGHTVGKELSYWKSHIPRGFPGGPGRSNTSGGSGFDISPIQDVVNAVKNDPRIQQTTDFVGELWNEGNKKYQNMINSSIKAGYLDKEGTFRGAAKNQALNFLSDLLPTLPGISHANKFQTEMYLASIGLSRERAGAGHQASQGMLTGGSGIDRAHMVGALQLNKMSDEAEGYYMNKIRARLAAGTLKSGDMINAYDLPKNSPIRREQGSVRFYVGPNGKPYLLDTYGFDPGNVDLGSQQAEYDKTVKKFQSGSGIIGKIAKTFDIRPMSDAMEGGDKIQLLLGIRNKLMGYDPRAEMEKGHDSKRLKTKAQVEELSGLGDLSHLIEPVKTAKIAPQQKPKIAPPPPPESFANTGTGRDGTFGEGTYGEGRPSDPSPSTPSIPNIPVIGGWLDKLNVLGLGG